MKKVRAIERVLARKRQEHPLPEKPDTFDSGIENISRDGFLVFGIFSVMVFFWGMACLFGAMLGGGLFSLARSWLGAVAGM